MFGEISDIYIQFSASANYLKFVFLKLDTILPVIQKLPNDD